MDDCFAYRIAAGLVRFLTDPGAVPERRVRADILFASPRHEPAAMAEMLRRIGPRLVVACHWDDMWLPLSRPLRPMLELPSITFPPVRRLDMVKFARSVREAGTGARPFVPEIFRAHNLEELL